MDGVMGSEGWVGQWGVRVGGGVRGGWGSGE